MKRVILVFVALLFHPLTLPAAVTPEQSYIEALQAYKSGQYAEAIEGFETLRSLGFDGFNIQYNLGNAFYKNGDVGKSILAFERALRLSPNHPDALHNLNVVRARTRDRVEPMPLLFFVQWWNDLRNSRLPDSFFVWSQVFVWIVAGSAFVFFGFRTRWIRRIALVVGIVSFAAFIISVTLYQSRVREFEERRFGVVMSAQVPVRSAPDESGVESFVIHEGLTVEILAAQNGLARIRLVDGKSGWVNEQSLERI